MSRNEKQKREHPSLITLSSMFLLPPLLVGCGDFSLGGEDSGAFDFPEVSSVIQMTLPQALAQFENAVISPLESDNDGLASPAEAFKLLLNVAPTTPEFSEKETNDLSGRLLTDVGAIDDAMADVEAALASADLTAFECLSATANEVTYDFNAGSGSELPTVTLKLQCKTLLPGTTNGSGIAFGQSDSDFYIHLHHAPTDATAEEGAELGTLLLVHVNAKTFQATVTGAILDPRGAGTSDDVQHIYQISSSFGASGFRAYSIGINQKHGLGCGIRMVAETNKAYIAGNFGSSGLSSCSQIGSVLTDAESCISSRTFSSLSSTSCDGMESAFDGFPSKAFDSNFKTQTEGMGAFFSVTSLPLEVADITLPEVPSSEE
jgi:hypothetical protein